MTAHAAEGRVFFHTRADARQYLDFLGDVVAEHGWMLPTYCLMTNHVHLVVRTPETNLGAGMKKLSERFAMLMNARRKQRGSLHLQRFYNKPVLSRDHFVGCLRYIARNPVAARMCASADAWEWSAHRSLTGEVPPPKFLAVEAALAPISDDPARARASYAELVASDDRQLLDRLLRERPDTALAEAYYAYKVPRETLTETLDLSRRTFYDRLKKANEEWRPDSH